MQNPYQYIGSRIREIRLQKNISQEKLAERANYSITHVSHIENGSTKLSVMALIKIANALEVNADMILCDCVLHSGETFKNEITHLIDGCDERQLRIIADMTKALKNALEKNDEKLPSE